MGVDLNPINPLQHMGAGSSNPIAQAASQAIAATQQLTGRRTSSLKASFDAVNHMQTHEFSLGRDAIPSSSSSQSSFPLDPTLDGPPIKKKKSKSTDQVLDVVSNGFLGDSLMDPGISSDLLTADLRSDGDWNFDPNEPRYCICNQVSYGDMVACDNEDVINMFMIMIFTFNNFSYFQCPYEWFHYDCVGISGKRY